MTAARFQVVVSEKIQNRADLAIPTVFPLNSSIDQIFCLDIEFDNERDEKSRFEPPRTGDAVKENHVFHSLLIRVSPRTSLGRFRNLMNVGSTLCSLVWTCSEDPLCT
jgi:hypothetical protein